MTANQLHKTHHNKHTKSRKGQKNMTSNKYTPFPQSGVTPELEKNLTLNTSLKYLCIT